MTGTLVRRVRDVWYFAADFLDDRRRSGVTPAEVRAVVDAEQVRILRHSSTPPEFDVALRRSFASQNLLFPAMRAINIDPVDFASQEAEWLRDMSLTCVACRHRIRCRHEIATSGFRSRFRLFCANSASFADILNAQAPPLESQPPRHV